MNQLLAKVIIEYLMVSLLFLLMFTYGPIDLETPKAWKKYKELLIILFCVFWPTMITILINTFRNRWRGE